MDVIVWGAERSDWGVVMGRVRYLWSKEMAGFQNRRKWLDLQKNLIQGMSERRL